MEGSNSSWDIIDFNEMNDSPGQTCTDGATLEEMDIFDVASWIVEGILVVVINFLGLIANSIAIPVLLSRRLTNRFNRILAVLAGFDAAYNFLDILKAIHDQHNEYSKYDYFENTCGPIPYYLFLHDYIHYRLLLALQSIIMMASIYTTVIVTLERYVAVSRPLSAFVEDGSDGWRKVFTYILPMFVVTVAFNMPKFFEYCGMEIMRQCPDNEPFYESECPPKSTTEENITSFSQSKISEHSTDVQCNYLVNPDYSINGTS
jgi:hypothetical protein